MTSAGLVDVSLSGHAGSENVVLLFFPGAFTSVCTQQMCDMTSGLGSFNEANARVYGISTDTPFAQAEWAKKLELGFPILSDYQHAVTEAYDVVWPDFAGLGPGTARAVFLIDKAGIIRYAEQTPSLGDLPNAEALVAALAELE